MGKAEEDESIHLLLIAPSNNSALLKVYTNSCTFTEESQKLNYPALGTAAASPPLSFLLSLNLTPVSSSSSQI